VGYKTKADISGGMAGKVWEFLKLARLKQQTIIIDRSIPGNLQKVFRDEEFVGTVGCATKGTASSTEYIGVVKRRSLFRVRRSPNPYGDGPLERSYPSNLKRIDKPKH